MSHWYFRYLEVAHLQATWSKDRTTKVGAVLYNPQTKAVLAGGFNGFPRSIDDDVDSRHERPAKYLWTEHAERNAIYNAANEGLCTRGLGMALDWFPCAACARGIIQSGFTELVCHRPDLTSGGRWVDEHTVALEMLLESSVKLIFLDDFKETTLVQP